MATASMASRRTFAHGNRPVRFLRIPPHCLKKNAVCALRQATSISSTHSSSMARAVLPVADLRAQADKHVDALAARGRPTVTVDRDQLRVRHNVEGFASEAIVLLAWLFPDQMRAKLHA